MLLGFVFVVYLYGAFGVFIADVVLSLVCLLCVSVCFVFVVYLCVWLFFVICFCPCVYRRVLFVVSVSVLGVDVSGSLLCSSVVCVMCSC